MSIPQNFLYVLDVKVPAESKEPWDYLKLGKIIPGEEAARPLSERACAIPTSAPWCCKKIRKRLVRGRLQFGDIGLERRAGLP